MVFLNRLAVPISVGENSQIIYYGFTQDISELEPYFNCAAYDGNSNVYSALEEMRYLHDTSFLAAKKTLKVFS